MIDDVVRPAFVEKLFRSVTKVPKAADVCSAPEEQLELRRRFRCRQRRRRIAPESRL